MKSKISASDSSIWWVILMVILIAFATMWWFGREIQDIDQRIENMEKI